MYAAATGIANLTQSYKSQALRFLNKRLDTISSPWFTKLFKPSQVTGFAGIGTVFSLEKFDFGCSEFLIKEFSGVAVPSVYHAKPGCVAFPKETWQPFVRTN
jgi:hypothetical protein